MTLLFYDTETTGLPQDSLPDDHPAQPHIVQLAAMLTTDDGREVSAINLIVKPDGWTIPESAAKVHGITTELAQQYGVPLLVALAAFTNLRSLANELIAHNITFDEKLIRTAIARTKRQPAHPGPEKHFCTMAASSPILKLPPTAKMKAAGFDKFKPPRLEEAYQFFFNEPLVGAHDAMADMRGCARVYFHLKTLETAGEAQRL